MRFITFDVSRPIIAKLKVACVTPLTPVTFVKSGSPHVPHRYLLGVYFFTLFLKSLQNVVAVQHKSNLFVLVVQLHQHVLNLKTSKEEGKKKKSVNSQV